MINHLSKKGVSCLWLKYLAKLSRELLPASKSLKFCHLCVKNKIIYILAFCINCFGPLIQEQDKVDELIKKFQEDNMDDKIFANMPDDFMPDLDEDEYNDED